MARIVGVDLPKNKRGEIGLTYIFGIGRARAVDILKSQGVKFLSEVVPCCTGKAEDKMAIVHAIDPDGVFLELVGSITPQPVQPQPEGCPVLEIKMPAVDTSTTTLDLDIHNND